MDVLLFGDDSALAEVRAEDADVQVLDYRHKMPFQDMHVTSLTQGCNSIEIQQAKSEDTCRYNYFTYTCTCDTSNVGLGTTHSPVITAVLQ